MPITVPIRRGDELPEGTDIDGQSGSRRLKEAKERLQRPSPLIAAARAVQVSAWSNGGQKILATGKKKRGRKHQGD